MPDTTPATDGASETPASETTTPPEAPETPDLGDAAKKALDSERKARRDADKRAKELAAELEKFQQAAMTETEKAIAAARQEATAETIRTFGSRLVDAEVKAAAAGRGVDIDALLEGLDRTRFLTDDGEPNAAAIKAWVDRIAPESSATPGVVDLGQGNRGGAAGSDMALNGDPLLASLKSKLNIR
jgi:membrane protein involved in colicin uptake